MYESFYRPDRQAVPAQPGSVVLLRQPRAQSCVRLPAVRPLPGRRLHRHHGRGRRGQDDDRSQPARAARSLEGRRRADRDRPSSMRTTCCAPWAWRSDCRSATCPRPSCSARSRPSCASSPAEKKRALLIVDEAQNLTPRAVEELRMLSNFQLGDQALLQSFLVGQPELADGDAKPADAAAPPAGHRLVPPRAARRDRGAGVHRAPAASRGLEGRPASSILPALRSSIR